MFEPHKSHKRYQCSFEEHIKHSFYKRRSFVNADHTHHRYVLTIVWRTLCLVGGHLIWITSFVLMRKILFYFCRSFNVCSSRSVTCAFIRMARPFHLFQRKFLIVLFFFLFCPDEIMKFR